MSAPFRLSPSDFGFLWAECRRCFYLKVAKGFPRPDSPFPGIFNRIDGAMKRRFHGMRSEAMAPGVPAGRVHASDEWVESVPLARPGRSATCFVRGIFDTVLALDDGTYAVVDFKTATIGPEQAVKYGRQLHAYALALERAAPGRMALAPVSVLGLLVFEPEEFSVNGGTASLGGRVQWLQVERDDAAFGEFLDEVLAVLERPDPPPAAPGCALCRYREASRAAGW